LRLAAEGEFELAFHEREHLFEIVAMRERPAAVGHQHVDEAIAPGRLGARHQDRIGAAGDRDMPHSGAVRIGDRQSAVGVIRRDWGARLRSRVRRIGHCLSPA